MKYFFRVLFTTSSILLFSGCSENKTIPLEAKAPQVVENPLGIEENKLRPIQKKEQNIVESKPLNTLAICNEKEEKNPESEDPIIIKTCTFRNYKSVSTGSPDNLSRYSWVHDLYKIENGKEIMINNSALFNNKQDELLEKINKRIKADYEAELNDPDHKDCFKDAEPLNTFKMDELNMYFESDKLVFNIELDLGWACLSASGFYASYSFKELEEYIK